MVPIRPLLMAGLVLVSTGWLIGCSDSGSDPGSLPQSNDLRLQPISTSLISPVFMTAPPADTTRLFIVQQGGAIRIFNITSGSLLTDPFLDISLLLSTVGERGLLGMTFDPQYDTNRQFYVFYTNTAGNIVIARYLRDAVNANLADSSTATLLLTVAHPTFSNHNGGMLAFGLDGCLYAGLGDGGGGGDPNNNAQSLSLPLGKILRLDPTDGSACTSGSTINPFNSLIWSRGLRNPWRFSFDRQTHDLYIGDVGQGAREEINVSPAPNAGRGLNYGWRLMEGTLCFNPSNNCNTGGLTLPVLDYPHLRTRA